MKLSRKELGFQTPPSLAHVTCC